MGTFWLWENFLDIADALWRWRERRKKQKRNMEKHFEFCPHPGWIVNPNTKAVEGILMGLKRNDGHCPCHNKYSGTEDDICPCKAYREEGHCCCHLYIKQAS